MLRRPNLGTSCLHMIRGNDSVQRKGVNLSIVGIKYTEKRTTVQTRHALYFHPFPDAKAFSIQS